MTDLFDHLKDVPKERLLLVIQELQSELRSREALSSSPIAIIGGACRFPGAYGLAEFWDLVSSGRCAIGDVPDARRWDREVYYDPNPDAVGKTYVWRGGFIDNVEWFDPGFFGIARREALRMDPQQRLMLESVWEAMENAGQTLSHLQSIRTGVYVGISTNDFLQIGCRKGDASFIDPYSGTGTAASIAAGRISYTLGLEGPNFPVDTACSSSLVALHLACQSLRNGETDSAIVTAVNLMLSPETTVYFAKVRALSPDGLCHTFDSSANGYVRSEGTGTLLLKRLDDAIANRDPILAVVRGSAINHDGRTSGLTVPNRGSQERLVQAALRNAALEPADIQYIEAHGTGTPLGDPIELQALGTVFRESHDANNPLLVGSVKTNIGHAEAAAGMAGVLKVALALQHRRVPPHLHFHHPNPYIPWAEIPVEIPVELQDWSSDQLLRAGISSFGFSGTNAHVILEEAPVSPQIEAITRPNQLLCLSAKSQTALRQLVTQVVQQLDQDDETTLTDACYTASAGRNQFAHRITINARDTIEARSKLAAAAQDEEALLEVDTNQQPKVAFLCMGQPAECFAASSLFEQQPEFAAAFNECELVVGSRAHAPMRESLTSAGGCVSQPALFAFQYSLARMWEQWGVRPAMVIGHSDGELVAAVLAGVMSMEDCFELLIGREQLLSELPDHGAMLAVRAAAKDVMAMLQSFGSVNVAAENAPQQTIISGSTSEIQQLAALCQQQNIITAPLQVRYGFHSPLLEPVLDQYRALVERVQLSAPSVGFLSGSTGRLEQQALVEPDYWCQVLRGPVRFCDSLEALAQRDYEVVLELGSSDSGIAMLRQFMGVGFQAAGSSSFVSVASVGRDADHWPHLVRTVESLYQAGVEIDWRQFHAAHGAKLVAWPNYPFQRDQVLEIPEELKDELTPVPAQPAIATTPQPPPNDCVETIPDQPVSPFDWIYDTHWIPYPLSADQTATASGAWLLLDDDDGLADEMAFKLTAEGHQVIRVRRGDAVEPIDQCAWTIDPRQPDHYRDLLSEVAKQGVACRGILHLWSANRSSQDDDEVGTWSLLHLVQAMVTGALPGTPQLAIVTRGAQVAEDRDQLLGLNQATTWGFARVAALEHPHLRCLRIDLDERSADRAAEAEALFGLLTVTDAEDQFALRQSDDGDDNARMSTLTPRLRHQGDALKSQDPYEVSAAATYLITGGTGGLGLLLAEWLAGRGAQHVVLTGRSQPKEPAQQRIEALQAQGVEVRVIRGDIGCENDVQRTVQAIRDEMPPLRGVIHAAGVLSDDAILKQDRERFERVMRPKVHGTLLLDAATRDDELDFFIGFSSIASLLSSPHQSNYAAANAFLDALMQRRRIQGLPGLSINWGPWREAGMAARLAETGSGGWNALGIEMLETQHAWELMPRLLATSSGQLGVIPTDWSRIFQLFPPGLEPPLLKELVRDDRPVPEPSPAWTALWEDLRAMPESEHASLVEQYVVHHVSETLGGGDVDPGTGLSELGMDSLMAVDLRTRLQTDVGFDHTLPITFAFDQPSIRDIAGWLHLQIIQPRLKGDALGETDVVTEKRSAEAFEWASMIPKPEETAPAPPAPASDAPLASNAMTRPGGTTEVGDDHVAAPIESSTWREDDTRSTLAQSGKPNEASEPIAIVGMACRFPKGTNSLEDYWRVLSEGIDCIEEVPASRWDADAWYDPDPDTPGRMNTRYGGFIDQVEDFDNDFFGISPREAIRMDPQHRLLLETTVHALEHARVPVRELGGSKTGVFYGLCGNDYIGVLRRANDPELMDGWLATGNAISIAAGRVAHILGMQGPAMVVDTACSSSLVAVHLACESLRNGESTMAVAGGVSLILGPEVTLSLTKARAMSPDGRCKTFDATANGYVRSEGCGIVVLEPLSKAIEQGHSVLAVIKGSAINHDGKSSGLTVPNRGAQENLLRAAWSQAEVEPTSIDYLEAHGTGTPLGDPIEMQALGAVFGEGRTAEDPVQVGSVKTNLGHLEAAAGVAGLIKTVLALQHNQIPPHLHFHQPNPYIPWSELPVAIPRECRDWRANGRPRLAGVSSFGFSGTNAHVVVGDVHPSAKPSAGPAASRAPRELASPDRVATGDSVADSTSQHSVLCLSGHTDEALKSYCHDLSRLIRQGKFPSLDAICRSAHVGRSHEEHRIVIHAETVDEVDHKLQRFAMGESLAGLGHGRAQRHPQPRVAFLFSGQGSQYAGMGRDLYRTQPRFRSVIDECDRWLRPYWDHALAELLTSDSPTLEKVLAQTQFTQPALFAIEYAIADLWRSWGVLPGAVLGHSSGEYAAACFAGLLSLEDGIKFVFERASHMASLPGGGAMAAVRAPESQVLDVIAACQQHAAQPQGRVEIAAANSPMNTVISGPQTAVEAVLARFAERGIHAVALNVSDAFHSAAMDPILELVGQDVDKLSWLKPEMGIVSNVTGKFLAPDEATCREYWQTHLRRPVRFADGVRTLQDAGYSIFVEVGPQPTLLGMARQCFQGDGGEWLPSLRKGKCGHEQMMESLASLYLRGVPVDWRAFHESQSNPLQASEWVDLPTTRFQRHRHWPETAPNLPPTEEEIAAATAGVAHRAASPAIPETGFLGRRLRSPLFRDVVFERTFTKSSPFFVDDHRVHSLLVVPGASHLSYAIEAAVADGSGQVRLQQVSFPEALILDEDKSRTMQFIMDRDQGDESRQWKVVTESPDVEDKWLVHANGALANQEEAGPPLAPDVAEIQERCTKMQFGAKQFYQIMARNGVQLGRSFQWNQAFWRRPNESLAQLESPVTEKELEGYTLFPGLIDSCIQLVATSIRVDDVDNSAYIPLFVESFDFYRRPEGKLWCHFIIDETQKTNASFSADWTLFTDEGDVVAHVQGMRFQRAPRAALMAFARRKMRDWLYRLRWVPLPAPIAGEEAPIGSTLVFSNDGPLAKRAVDTLSQAGVEYAIVRRGIGPLRTTVEQNGSQGEYAIDPTEPEQIAQLWEQLGEVGRGEWNHILYFWGETDEPALDELSLKHVDDSLDGALYPLFELSRIAGRLRNGRPPMLWVLTRGVHQVLNETNSGRVTASPIWGFCRTMAIEIPHLRSVRVDLETGGETDNELQLLLHHMRTPSNEDQLAFRAGTRYAARLLRGSDASRVSSGEHVLNTDEPYRLTKSDRGVIEDLGFAPMSRVKPEDGEIEIAVQATSLNFRDILNAVNLYPGEAGPLGLECAGIVARVGEGVTEYKPGDRVMALAAGCFAQFTMTDCRWVAPLPDELSLTEGASLPIVFQTAVYGLSHLAKLKAGDTVLVHSAAGGVGHAAIEVARDVGATVIATAGNPDKRAYLKAKGIEHVFDSRTYEFSEQVLEVTGGRGVDVVLNFLPGEAIAHNLKALAKGGRFIEIGKIDIWDEHKMSEVRPDVDYHILALDELIYHKPHIVAELFDEIAVKFQDGTYKVPSIHDYELQDVHEAFRFLAGAKHIGKVVVTHPEADLSKGESGPTKRGTWLLTGGLGFLGLHTARFLAEQGVQRIVLASRRQPNEQSAAIIEAIRDAGTVVEAISADVSEASEVRQLVEVSDAPDAPLVGVVHLAGLLDDGMIENQTRDRFQHVINPKLRAAWHLHEATKDYDLAAFVMFSSAAALLGSPGQSNYAAANAFLDGLAHARRQNGLKALSVNWGAWADGGMAEQVASKQQWELMGLTQIPPDDGMDVLDMLMEENATQAAVLPIDWQKMLSRFPPGTEPPVLAALTGERRAPAEPSKEWLELVARVEAAPPAERVGFLVEHMQQQVGSLLGFDQSQQLDPHAPLNDLGFDSLMAVEMANQFTSASGVSLPVTLLFDYPTLHSMSGYMVREVLKLETGEETVAATAVEERPQSVDELTASLLDTIERLTDDEVQERLR